MNTTRDSLFMWNKKNDLFSFLFLRSKRHFAAEYHHHSVVYYYAYILWVSRNRMFLAMKIFYAESTQASYFVELLMYIYTVSSDLGHPPHSCSENWTPMYGSGYIEQKDSPRGCTRKYILDIHYLYFYQSAIFFLLRVKEKILLLVLKKRTGGINQTLKLIKVEMRQISKKDFFSKLYFFE